MEVNHKWGGVPYPQFRKHLSGVNHSFIAYSSQIASLRQNVFFFCGTGIRHQQLPDRLAASNSLPSFKICLPTTRGEASGVGAMERAVVDSTSRSQDMAKYIGLYSRLL